MSNCNCESNINFGVYPSILPKPATCPEPTGPHPVPQACGCPKRPEPPKFIPTPFCTQVLPASMGTDEEGEPYAPKLGAYFNTLVHYLANGANVFYDSEGVPTRLSDYTAIYDQITALQTQLADEVTAREDADTSLDAALKEEVAARQQADTWLQQNINAEVNARELDRDNLQANINKEVMLREAADSNLQEQLDAIVNSSDVKDVVGTYAELESYDKSTLGDNDIIKVLNDETHDGAITYYRYNKSSNAFVYIGEVGPYYTKSEVNEQFATQDSITVLDTLISEKQDILESGVNLKTINGESLLGEGNIEISGGGGGDEITLYDEFGTNTDGALTQAFVSNILDSPYPKIGQFTNTSSATAIILGRNNISSRVPTMVMGLDNLSLTATNRDTVSWCNTIVGRQNGTYDATLTFPAGENVVAVGYRNVCTGNRGIAIGGLAYAGKDSVTIGGSNGTTDLQSALVSGGSAGNVTLGRTATTNRAQYSVALGYAANVTRSGEVNVGLEASPTSGLGYAGTNFRVIGGVHAGVQDNDVVNVEQLNAAIANLQEQIDALKA